MRLGVIPILISMLLPLSARGTPAQTETPSYPTEVERVMVDVVVTGDHDRALSSLGREDFVLLEDGKPQTIDSFEHIEAPPTANSSPASLPRVSSNASGSEGARGRIFVVVFDDLHLTRSGALRAKGAVAEFLESGVRDGDHVTLAATSGDAWWSATIPAGREDLLAMVKRLQGRYVIDTQPDHVTPWEAQRIHVDHDMEVADRVMRRFQSYDIIPPAAGQDFQSTPNLYPSGHPTVLARASAVYLNETSRNRATLTMLQRIASSLATSHGRKGIVLISEGFVRQPELNEFNHCLDAARRANTAIYFLDARGIQGMAMLATAEFGIALDPVDFSAGFLDDTLASEGTEILASDSGGFSVKNNNDLAPGFARISRESEDYYLIGYHSTNTAADGRFRKIDVKVKRKGVMVRARKGYFAPVPAPSAASAPRLSVVALQQAFDAPFDMDAFPMRASALVLAEAFGGRAKVVLDAEVDVRGLTLMEKDGRLRDDLDVLMAISHRDSGETFRGDQKVELKLLPEAKDKLALDWYAVVKDFDLPPGRYRAKVVVRDGNSGKIASISHEFEVADLTSLRISTPLMSDALAPGSNPHPVLHLRRSYGESATLYCEYQVYAAARDGATGKPRVSAGYAVRGADGETLRASEPDPIRPTSIGALSRLIAVPLAGSPPGAYELVLTLRDDVSGNTIVSAEPFRIEPVAQ
jgi:VWFA-related protein